MAVNQKENKKKNAIRIGALIVAGVMAISVLLMTVIK